MSESTQNFGNHVRYVTGYHFVLFTLLIANLVYTLIRLRTFNVQNVFHVVVAVSLILTAWYARVFALTVTVEV